MFYYVRTVLVKVYFYPCFGITTILIQPLILLSYFVILLLDKIPFLTIIKKYCKKAERQKQSSIWRDKLQEGIEQVRGYLQLPDLKERAKLSAWLMLTDGETITVERVEK